MNTQKNIITIPKHLTRKGDLVVISREEYEALQTLKKIQDFSPTQSQKKALRCAERNFLRGTTLSYHELSKQLGFTH